MLKDDDFDLIGEDEVSLASIEEETEHVDAELISDFDDFATSSLAIQKKNKEALAQLRDQVMFSLDKRKLEEAKKILTSLENIGSMFSDTEIMDRVRENVSTAQDLKFLSEAYGKLLDSQQRLMRMDSVDGAGNAKKISIGVQYEDEGGTKLQTVVKVGD